MDSFWSCLGLALVWRSKGVVKNPVSGPASTWLEASRSHRRSVDPDRGRPPMMIRLVQLVVVGGVMFWVKEFMWFGGFGGCDSFGEICSL